MNRNLIIQYLQIFSKISLFSSFHTTQITLSFAYKLSCFTFLSFYKTGFELTKMIKKVPFKYLIRSSADGIKNIFQRFYLAKKLKLRRINNKNKK